MSWSIICAAQVAPQRWKNDGGWTRELLAWPHPADWILRVSVADIEADGPFSSFPGVQRWFAVLSGRGVRLYDFELHPESELISFDGALGPDCELVDGPTRDFNLMHQRAKGRMQVQAVEQGPPPTGRLVALFTAEGGVLSHGGRAMKLAPQSLAWCEDPVAQPLAFTGAGAAWWMVWSEA
ncbi:HutD/Ves family protein [Roseateles violae]|uniref:HutD family protein n=1 Tax=Roseateles violae TaxID=3058042 RepID=A0ABT8DWX5_9BURK|nr:HutD family protein [Pelomonas sp. PFR6]MDN3920821.1 HutD family protein [Pelomonas sp. PFR6]